MKKLSALARYAFLCLLVSVSATTFATNHYVDPSSGSSVANGTLASPWKTIAQVNSGTTILNPGDTVFFKRGQTYSGKLTIPRSGVAGRPIVYTPYGTGALPEFNNNVSNIIVLSNRQYVVINGIKIIDRSIEYADPNHQLDANIDYAISLYNSSYCTISNCDLSLVGVGISTNTGSDYTTITGNYMHNMRMVKNAPGGNDDYGANPMVIGSSYNTITNNRFEECWALSYDFGYDGGAVELFGTAMNNNLIMYNTAINCNGFMEIGSAGSGVANNNIVAYNKIINCGSIGTYQTGGTFATSINNLQYYNNIVIETVRQYAKPAALFWMYASGPQGMVVAKNNIFWLSTGINFAGSKFNAGEMVHNNNIYRMSGGVLGVTLHGSEQYSNNATNLFSTTAGDPAIWNFSLQNSSPAINFGTGVALTKDFAGAAIVGNPDAGILESNSFAPVAPVALNATATAAAINCNGGTTNVTVAATGGKTPYTGTGSFTVTAGTYNYYVTDASGAKDTATITVVQPTAVSASLTAGAVATVGGTTTITVAASGGTAPYTYSLNGSAYQSVNIFSSVPAGTHSVITRDAKACAITKSITITQSSALNATATAGTINCYGGTTTVTIVATGGKSPYTGTGSFTVSAGIYNYYISDANGAKDTATISIAQPTAINATVSAGAVTTAGGTTTITIAASGGASPYMYNLDGGAYQSTNTFSNVLADTHSVITRDAKGCTISRSVSISQTLALTATATALPISCFGGTTIVTVKATGGKIPYYNTHDYTESAGVKTYIVIDASGARDTVSITLAQPTAISANLTAGSITTSGGVTTIAVTASGGTSPYTYSLNGGAYQTSNSFGNVLAGTYSIIVKDSKGCTLSKTITIAASQFAPLTATVSAGTINCYGGTTTVTVKATGGKTPYYNTHDYTESAGVKTYIVIDANGARDTVTIAIAQPAALNATLTAGSNSISVAASGGTAPYTYSIAGGIFQTSNTFNNMELGTHTVVVKDSKGCTTSKTISLTDAKFALSTNNNFLVQAYPNPSAGSFSVAIANGGFQAVTLTVFNELGTVFYNAKGSANSIFRFGGSFMPGIYFLKVTSGGVSQTVQLVKM